MNGSRSKNHNLFADESTFETLSRTIEDLEKKILGVSNANPRAASPLERTHSNSTDFSHSANLRDEVRARQHSLSGGNPPSFARNVNSRNTNQGFLQTSSTQEQNHFKQNSQSSGELAGLLSQLRRELKQDMQATINGEVGRLQKDILDLRHTAIKDNMPASLGSDLEQIAQSLKQLEAGYPVDQGNQDIDSLRLEVDSLRNLVDKLAREDTLVGLDNRWSSIEQNLQGFDPNIMKGEFSDLSGRLAEMRLVLANMNENGPMLRPLEEKLENISSAVAALIDRPEQAQNYTQFTEFTSQTEQRLAQLADQIEGLSDRSEAGLIDRIEAISSRINTLSNEDAYQNLEKRMAHLQASLDNSSGAGHFPQLDERLSELSNKVDAIDQRASTVETAGIERLVSQLTDVATQLDKRAQPIEINGIDRLEEQLLQLNARLDNSRESVNPNVDGLQQQIEQLSELVRGTNVSDVSEKLDNLHEHLNTNDEFVLEAAKQAAEATLQAHGSTPAHGDSTNSNTDDNVISGLVKELKHLENLQLSSEDRNIKAFNTVQQSLVKIVEGLERLNSQVSDTPSTLNSVLTEQHAAPSQSSGSDAYQAVENQTAPALAPEEIPFRNEEDVPEVISSAPHVMPEAATAFLEERVSEEEPREQAAPANGTNSLLAGLASRMKTAVVDKNERAQAPQSEDQLAPRNVLDELESEFADEPLEPGSGAPDINSIMQKVRDVQKSRSTQETTSTNSNPQDLVSAARRAALAASSEVGAEEEQPRKRRFQLREPGKNSPLVSKPVLIAAGAILVAILAFPVVKQVLDIGGSSGQTEQISLDQSNDQSFKSEDVTPQVVQNDTNSPVETPLENAAPRIVELPNTTASTEGTDIQEQDIFASANKDESSANPHVNVSENADDVIAATPETIAPSRQVAPETLAAVNELPPSIASGALKEAALSGDPIALYEIAARYADGRDTDVANDKAMKWLELSADQNFAPAQYRLGNMYEKGEGVARNLDKARELYLKSANNGNISAMHNLGVLLASSGSLGEMEKAANWFRQAADFGVRDSQVNMAILHARGEGLPRDLVESYKWFAIAAAQGDQDAAVKRDQVLNALPEDRAKIAQEKAKSWVASPVDKLANNVQIPDAWVSRNSGTASIDMQKAIKNIQAILNNNGYDAGRPDGIIGAKTTDAIKAFQTSIGMEPNGQISDKLVQELLKRNG
ncbi:peptidoglycan-binding protein [Lentilitoribacter sp. Alg239-R112]|uniref:peptidoglycan-binding protein n=1 Tax=Lentilitoribacter sp. Alg239-R112 TaxID=2305987 RepID=UPI0013A6EF3B|nr:peptidoglycan-binding protein [Lentilitoribacter sp. Alg239-R112]